VSATFAAIRTSSRAEDQPQAIEFQPARSTVRPILQL
jgi:hypothetical protein